MENVKSMVSKLEKVELSLRVREVLLRLCCVYANCLQNQDTTDFHEGEDLCIVKGVQHVVRFTRLQSYRLQKLTCSNEHCLECFRRKTDSILCTLIA